MAEFVVAAADFAALFTRQETARARRVCEVAPRDAAEEGRVLVAKAAPVDLAHLANSTHVVQGPGPVVAEVVVDAPYAAAVENGARPHTAPLQPLLEWARRHVGAAAPGRKAARRRLKRPALRPGTRAHMAGLSREARRGLRLARLQGFQRAARRANTGGSEAAARALAVSIQRRIARIGAAPTHYVRGTLPAQVAALGRAIRAQIQDA